MNRLHGLALGEPGKGWLWLMVVGAISSILGFVGLGMTFTVTMASVVLFGVFFLIGGFVQLVQAFKGSGSLVLPVLIALAYLVAGGVTARNPVLASFIFTIVLAWFNHRCRLVSPDHGMAEQGIAWLGPNVFWRCYFRGSWPHDYRQMAGVRTICHRALHRDRADRERRDLYYCFARGPRTFKGAGPGAA